MTFHTNRLYSNESISRWDNNANSIKSKTDDASKWIVANYSKNTFAGSLMKQFCRWGKLSDRQWEAAAKAAAKAAAPKPKSEHALPNIRKLLEGAEGNLKAPIIKFEGMRLKLAGERSKHSGRIFVDKGEFGTSICCIEKDGSMTKYREFNEETLAILQKLESDPVGELARHGKELNSCCFCSKELSDSRSVDAGYGAKCAGNYSLPWG